jgi:hypothetical protein
MRLGLGVGKNKVPTSFFSTNVDVGTLGRDSKPNEKAPTSSFFPIVNYNDDGIPNQVITCPSLGWANAPTYDDWVTVLSAQTISLTLSNPEHYFG